MSKRKSKKRKIFEDYAYVLDYLEYGYPDDKRPLHQQKPIAQAFGEKQFVLMELVLKDDKTAELAERVYIGKGKRDKVEYVSKMLKYEDLTPTANRVISYYKKSS
jgi:putative nucleotide binding protein